MLKDDYGYKLCPFSGNLPWSQCRGDECAAYDIIPAEYTMNKKPVERCLMMQPPFYPAPCCGPVTEFKDEVEVTLYKENEENG